MAKRNSPQPPRDEHGRFLKGHSGNKGGRPKGRSSASAGETGKIAIKQGGRTRYADPADLIMKKLSRKAIVEEDVEAARLYMREVRLRQRQLSKPAESRRAPPRPRHRILYYEEALMAFGLLKLNHHGQFVIPRAVVPEIDRVFSKGAHDARAWRALQLAAETPEVLRARYPRRRLHYANVAQANRARAAALDAASAEYEALVEDAEDKKGGGKGRGKRRP